MIRLAMFLLSILSITLLTQVGGIAVLLAAGMHQVLTHGLNRKWSRRIVFTGLVLVTYSMMTLFVIPPLAKMAGRPALPCVASPGVGYAARSLLTCALNRNYAVPQIHLMLQRLARDMDAQLPPTIIGYLDAGFPFFDWFPMLPHLSHSDAKRIDLSFFYVDGAGIYQPLKTPSPVGYWAFIDPVQDEPQPCQGRRDIASLRWNMAWFQPLLSQMQPDFVRTRFMLRWLTDEGPRYGVRRILLEPHLKQRFMPVSNIVRFQGCRAARHDDHVHIDIE